MTAGQSHEHARRAHPGGFALDRVEDFVDSQGLRGHSHDDMCSMLAGDDVDIDHRDDRLIPLRHAAHGRAAVLDHADNLGQTGLITVEAHSDHGFAVFEAHMLRAMDHV